MSLLHMWLSIQLLHHAVPCLLSFVKSYALEIQPFSSLAQLFPSSHLPCFLACNDWTKIVKFMYLLHFSPFSLISHWVRKLEITGGDAYIDLAQGYLVLKGIFFLDCPSCYWWKFYQKCYILGICMQQCCITCVGGKCFCPPRKLSARSKHFSRTL